MTLTNPFRSYQPALTPVRKPLSDAARAALRGDHTDDPAILAEVKAHIDHHPARMKDISYPIDKIGADFIRPMTKRIEALEHALAFALAESEKSIRDQVDQFLDTTPPPDMAELERRTRQHLQKMKSLPDAVDRTGYDRTPQEKMQKEQGHE